MERKGHIGHNTLHCLLQSQHVSEQNKEANHLPRTTPAQVVRQSRRRLAGWSTHVASDVPDAKIRRH
ncbi:hypothetical protein Pmani_015260, partial [Petrolisthes manimaculis]